MTVKAQKCNLWRFGRDRGRLGGIMVKQPPATRHEDRKAKKLIERIATMTLSSQAAQEAVPKTAAKPTAPKPHSTPLDYTQYL